MRLICNAIGIALLTAATAAAQTSTTQTTRKIEVKDGRNITVTGCLAENPGGGFKLIGDNGSLKYVLITDEDLSKRVGHRVEVKGRAADQGDGKVKIESKTVGTSGEISKSTTESTGDLAGMPFLGVKSIKKIADGCR
ncbi:MAG TPA: hypothetical protein VGY57_01180 [Vicinamibacterales bacterium]|nr:hypothetical protein [Vicinamibacterales bacterium]